MTDESKLIARDRLIALLRIPKGAAILDVGCGRGLLGIGFAMAVPRSKVYAVDIWNEEEIAGNKAEWVHENARRENVETRVFPKTGDAADLPFSDASFDAVVSNLVIHNLRTDKQEQSFSEMYRVLRPGGQVLYSDIDKRGQIDRAVAAFRRLGFGGIQVHNVIELIAQPSIYMRALTAVKSPSR